ncbi:ubiquitin fusion degradation UFD1 family protein [Citrus sinensis]|uniref:Ubiquitin fusion degradation UFD1 family protein n=1 Tax=Citrus sinensis TaxID=2711 RepID=A0ACB8N5G0_CITSI|nr:ubiquitin fusion degradation UFD1 family protein [Citrus sinensis]
MRNLNDILPKGQRGSALSYGDKFPFFCGHGSGDKIKLPPSCFTELSGQGAFDKGPLHFNLSVLHQEGPSNMVDGEKESNRSTHSDPVEIGFAELPNQKAVLETSLRQHATLSQDDVLTVNYRELAYKLKVLELKPSSSVSVLETDIEVNIVSPDDMSAGTDQYTLKPLLFGKSESGMVEEGKYVFYKFTIDDDTRSKVVILSSKDKFVDDATSSQLGREKKESKGDTKLVRSGPIFYH